MKIKKIFYSITAGLVIIPALVMGATFRAGDEVSVPQGVEVQDNVYAFGGIVSIKSTVMGDVYAAGGNVLISGDVTEDVVALGGTVTVLGNSGGDVRVSGGTVLLDGTIAGEVIVAGGQVTVSADTVIGRDLVVVGGQVSLDGQVEGGVRIIGGSLTVDGRVQGNVEVDVQESLTVGPGAAVGGSLIYNAHAQEVLLLDQSAVVQGETIFQMKEKDVMSADRQDGAASSFVAVLGLLFVGRWLAYVIATITIVWLCKKMSLQIAKHAIAEPLINVGRGFVVLVVVPVLVLLLLVSLLGIPLGLLLLPVYGLLLGLAKIYSGVIVGVWLSKRLYVIEDAEITWKNIIGGVTVLTIAGVIPVVGWAVSLGVFLVALGSVSQTLYARLINN